MAGYPRPEIPRAKHGFHSTILYSNIIPEQSYNRIPGYKGHVPGLRVEGEGIGTSMGKGSHYSMSQGRTTMGMTGTLSGRTKYYDRVNTDAVLRKAEEKHTYGHSTDSDRYRVRHRPGSKTRHEDVKYSSDIPPGYTGFIPQSRHITGATRAVTNTLGLAAHDRLQATKQSQLDRTAAAKYANPDKLRELPEYGPNSNNYISKTLSKPVPATAYSPQTGMMYGCTKFMPQRKWTSVSQTQGAWSKQTATFVDSIHTSSKTTSPRTTTPSFEAKPRGYAWKVR